MEDFETVPDDEHDRLEVVHINTGVQWGFTFERDEQGRRYLSEPVTAYWGAEPPASWLHQAACTHAREQALRAGKIDA